MEEFEPIPGNLCNWASRRAEDLTKRAMNGALYQIELDQFQNRVNSLSNMYRNENEYSEEIVQDAINAELRLKGYLEQIFKTRENRSNWLQDIENSLSHNLVVLRETGQQSIKYVLLGYGVVFITLFGTLFSQKINNEFFPAIFYALKVFAFGFSLIIVGLSITHVATRLLIENLNVLKRSNNIDKDRKPWIFKMSLIGESLIILSGIFIIIGILVFVFQSSNIYLINIQTPK